MNDQPTKLQFAKIVFVPVLWLFVVPVVTLVFTHLARPKMRWGPYAEQFAQAHEVAQWALSLGAMAVVGAVILGCIAFANREAQTWAFMFGWRALVMVAGVEVVVQGGLATWLSYWLTAFYMQIYSVKLVAVVGMVALFAVWTVIRGIFRKMPSSQPLEAEVVSERDAPLLWTRLRELASRLRTEPPKHVVAGIDDNFFVTEHGVTLTSGKLEGRTLYVSLPLLRVLKPSEADAVFSHEIAHLKGGDTAVSAQLGPELVRYNVYMNELASGGITKPVFYLLRMFNAIFELALAREKRSRELIADKAAARVTSADDVGRSLIKTTAYSSFRIETERSLFSHNALHTQSLALKERIDAGLGAHVATRDFAETLKSMRTPHPFDTHPLLEERLKNVASHVRFDQAAEMLLEPRSHTWVDDIATAAAIEQRLWDAYETRFREQHEQSLAFRYRPANDEERALVERFFPPCDFSDGKEYAVRITYEGLVIPRCDVPLLRFEHIVKATIENRSFVNELRLEYQLAGAKKTAKVNLRKLGKQAEAVNAVFNHYWLRDQAARQHQA